MSVEAVIDSTISPFIRSSEKLGGLTPAAIFAFMWLVQFVKESRRESHEATMKEKDIEKRDAAIRAEQMQTEAIKAMADKMVTIQTNQSVILQNLLKQTTIIEERLHK